MIFIQRAQNSSNYSARIWVWCHLVRRDWNNGTQSCSSDGFAHDFRVQRDRKCIEQLQLSDEHRRLVTWSVASRIKDNEERPSIIVTRLYARVYVTRTCRVVLRAWMRIGLRLSIPPVASLHKFKPFRNRLYAPLPVMARFARERSRHVRTHTRLCVKTHGSLEEMIVPRGGTTCLWFHEKLDWRRKVRRVYVSGGLQEL